MTRTRVRMTVLVVVLVWAVVGCDALPRHTENGQTVEFDMLAVGDSFTAGNGAGGGYFPISEDDVRDDSDETRPFIRQKEMNSGDQGCFRNHGNYLRQLHFELNSAGAYINAACSGDTTDNLVAATAPDSQLAGFSEAQRNEVDFIAVSIGGNDLDFANFIQDCLVIRDHADCQHQVNFANDMLAVGSNGHSTVSSRISVAMFHLAANFPNARVVLVGYPVFYEGSDLVLHPGLTCPLCDPIRPADQIEWGIDELNEQQEMIVDELNGGVYGHRFAFLPLHNSSNSGLFDGRGMDGGPADDWIHSPGGSGTTYVGEWFHPNAAGHEAIAQALYEMPFVQDAFWDVQPGPVLHSVALGDGYSAGSGALGTSGDGYMDKSPEDMRDDTEAPGCNRNINNYMHQLTGTFNLSRGWTITAACSGAFANALSGQYEGFSETEQQAVDLVTLTAGGMDMGWTDIVQDCYVNPDGNTCKLRLDSTVTTLNNLLQLHQNNLWQYNPLVQELMDIAGTFTGAQTVVIGYPVINENPGHVLCLTNTNPCPAGQQYNPLARLREAVNLMNQAQQETVAYVNTELGAVRTAFLPLHNSTNTGPFDGLGVGGAGEDMITSNSSELSFEELYHPTREGHTVIADALNDMPFVQAVIDGVPQND